jgi:hypothetical protein
MRRLPILPMPLLVQPTSLSVQALSKLRMHVAQKASSKTVVSRMSLVASVMVALAVSPTWRGSVG